MSKNLLIAFLTVLVLSSCQYIGGKRVHGNGNIVSRERSTAAFHSVELSGALDIVVKQDSSLTKVVVETDENLQEFIEIYESNGVLHISPANNYNLSPTKKISIHVTSPHFRHFGISGASEIRGENKLVSNETIDIDLTGASELKLDMKAPKVNVEASGASTIALNGETKDLNIGGSGASNFRCFDLLTENVTVDLSGACSAEVYGSVKLDIEASGASGVQYRGTGAVSQDLSGASSIKKVD